VSEMEQNNMTLLYRYFMQHKLFQWI